METNQSSTLLGRVREVIRYKHYSIRTERTYVEWVRRFVAFHGRRHPREMGAEDVRAFLGYLASEWIGPKSRSGRRCRLGGNRQAGVDAYAASLLRHASAGIRLRHSHSAGTAGAFGCVDDDDLHPRAQSRWARCGVAAGCRVAMTGIFCLVRIPCAEEALP